MTMKSTRTLTTVLVVLSCATAGAAPVLTVRPSPAPNAFSSPNFFPPGYLTNAFNSLENNLGNIDVGDEAAIVLDVMPGVVLKGRVRSVGGGVSSGQNGTPGTLPTVENNRDWLRQAQRIPVVIEFDASDVSRLKGVRVGGQADVLVYTGESRIMNFFGAIYIRVMSWLSYFY